MSAPDSSYSKRKGLLDLTQEHIGANPVKLDGDWTFYWHELLSPEDIRSRMEKGGPSDRYINIPGSWLGYPLDGQELTGEGFATFRLFIQLSEQDRNERLALRLPTIFHAYKLWVNGELLADSGMVGQDISNMTPQLATKLVFFESKDDRIELVMQVSISIIIEAALPKR